MKSFPDLIPDTYKFTPNKFFRSNGMTWVVKADMQAVFNLT